MTPRKKTAEEKKIEKRAREKARYEKNKSDPIKAMEIKQRMHSNYMSRKEKQKPFCSKSDREKRSLRKQWRVKKRTYRLKKKGNNQPQPNLEEDVNFNARLESEKTSHQLDSGKKRKERNKKRRNREYIVMKRHMDAKDLRIQELERKCDRLRKQLERQKQKNSKSPRSLVNQITKYKDTHVVKRKLLFGETLERQIRENLLTIKSRKGRHDFVKNIIGDAKWLRKYGLLQKFKFIPSKLFRNCLRRNVSNGAYNRRIKTVTHQVRKDVENFLQEDENSKLCPGKKDCVTVKKIKKQKRLLLEDLKVLHAKFCATRSYNISYSSFTRLKPFWVVRPNINQRETCQCIKHANFELLVKGLYDAKAIASPQVKKIRMQLCCETKTDQCYFRTCQLCRDKSILYGNFDGTKAINYEQWMSTNVDYEDPKSKLIKTTKRLKKNTFTKPLLEVIRLANSESLKFLVHEGNIFHQNKEIKNLKATLSPEEALIHMDFSENYATKYNTEVQSIHFGGNRQSISLHTVVVYFRESSFTSSISLKNFCTLSENLNHGPAAIWIHLKPIFNFIHHHVPAITSIHFLSDGPSSQYRNKTMFWFIQWKLHEEFPSINLATWNYHESGHGKGAPDGIGGVVKRTADTVVAHGGDISNIDSMVLALKKKITGVDFHVIKASAIQEMSKSIPAGIKPFQGSLKTHQVVWKKGEAALSMNRLSSFSFSASNNCKTYNLGSHITLPSHEKIKCSTRPMKISTKKSKISPIRTSEKALTLPIEQNNNNKHKNNNKPTHDVDFEEIISAGRSDDLIEDTKYVNKSAILDCTRGLCFECGGSITQNKKGRFCDVCQDITYHVTCVPQIIESSQDSLDALNLFCCKKCDLFAISLNLQE